MRSRHTTRHTTRAMVHRISCAGVLSTHKVHGGMGYAESLVCGVNTCHAAAAPAGGPVSSPGLVASFASMRCVGAFTSAWSFRPDSSAVRKAGSLWDRAGRTAAAADADAAAASVNAEAEAVAAAAMAAAADQSVCAVKPCAKATSCVVVNKLHLRLPCWQHPHPLAWGTKHMC